MGKLSAISATAPIKLLYIGDSGSGKTGSLASLVKDGYKIRMLDYDSGIDSLRTFVLHECPDKIDNIDVIQLRDKIKVAPSAIYGGQAGPVVAPGQAKAFTDGLKFLDKWDDGSTPSEWGLDTIFVLDSLSAYGRAAFAWAQGMNPSSKDPRQWFGQAQKGVEDTIALLTSPAFNTNVIIISHVNYKEVTEGVSKGYPNAVGTALGPVIARYFNTLILAESTGSGRMTRRKIKTVPTGIIDLKSPIPFSLEAELPLETGMATLFQQLKAAMK